jgi:hypothetical protein
MTLMFTYLRQISNDTLKQFHQRYCKSKVILQPHNFIIHINLIKINSSSQSGMNVIFRKLTLLLASAGLVTARTAVRGATNRRLQQFNNNFFIRSQAIYSPEWESYRIAPFKNHDYSESGFDMLTEMRAAMESSGMNQFKFKLSNNACESYRMNCSGKDAGFALRDLARESEVANTFNDTRFDWYHIWTYTFNLPKPLQDDMTQDVSAAEYQETYDFVVHLLKTYADTGKTFFIGNWEGDWELMWASGCKTEAGFDMTCHPTDEVVARYVTWSSIRQTAIDDAKAAVGASDVQVFHYIEFNLAEENFEEDNTRHTILNSVVPEVNPDYLSYSAYLSTDRYMNHQDPRFN